MLPNTTTHILRNLKNSSCDKTPKYNCYKTQKTTKITKLNIYYHNNSKTQIQTNLKKSCAQLFWAPILIRWWGVFYQQGLPCLVFTSWLSWGYCFIFSRILPYRFEINLVIFRPQLDMYRGVSGLPGRNKNLSLHKTDSRNVLSDL